jgi:hypothetical protein
MRKARPELILLEELPDEEVDRLQKEFEDTKRQG